MANRIVLNETSYHGSGAIKEIVNEVKGRNLWYISVNFIGYVGLKEKNIREVE